MTNYQIAIWTLIAVGITAVAYLGQLFVLLLIYFRVIREADRNAEIRKQEIAKAGDMMQEQGKDMVQRMNGIAKRNTVIMAIMGAALSGMLLRNQAVTSKFERGTKREQGKR